MARLPYADPDRPETAELVARITAQRGGVLHLYAMLLHSPPVADGWLHFLSAIRQRCDLPGALRELVILQVAHLNGAPYEAEQHTPIALREGVRQAQVDALPDWRTSDAFEPAQRAALAYCDAMTRTIHVPADVFADLRAHFDPRAIVELTATVGAYNMVSRFLEALGISSADDMRAGRAMTDPFSLEGKVALITGCGSQGPGWGNGKATAVTFARRGARVYGVDLNAEAAEETRRLVEDEGGRFAVGIGSVTDRVTVEGLVADCRARFGRVDILVNNVGLSIPGSPAVMTEADWDAQIEINLKSAFLCTRSVLPGMIEQGGGAVVSIASTAAIRYSGKPQAAYAAAKAGLIQFSRVAAVEYAARGVRLNCVLPGLIETPLVERLARQFASVETGLDREAFYKRRHQQPPMGRMGEAFDVAHAALYLASDAAKYVTGTEILVDGGLCATVPS